MKCEDCSLGKAERVVGNGITEPPYLFLVRCPYEQEYYKHPDEDCTHAEEAAQAGEGGTDG